MPALDIERLTRQIAAAADELFPQHQWHVGALAPTDADPKWTVVVRTSPLVAPLFVTRELTLADGLYGLTACVLEEAWKQRAKGEALDRLVAAVNEMPEVDHG